MAIKQQMKQPEMSEPNKPDVRLVKSGSRPGYRTRVLVVDPDPAAVALVSNILHVLDWEVLSVGTGAEALRKAREEGPDAILMEMELPDMAGPDLCRALRQRTETAATPIVVLSANPGIAERVASLRAGASDYLIKPPDAQDLVARLRAALDLRQDKAGFVIAVIGARGGAGASTLAANLAIALRQETRGSVVLVDGAGESGVQDVLLNLQASRTLAQALARLDDLEDKDLELLLASHSSGVQAMLLQEHGPGPLPAEEMRKALLALRRLRDWVVVDVPGQMDELTPAVLELADRALLVVTPEITALRGARLFLNRARRLGLPRERIMPILNRFPQPGGLERSAIEQSLGLPLQEIIPDDAKLVTYSTNRGVPIMLSHAHSKPARHIAALAKSLVQAARGQ